MKPFTIEIPHFYCIEYIEEEKRTMVDVDLRDIVIHLEESMINKWEEPYQNEMLSKEDKKRILNNIYNWLLHEGLYVTLD